MVLKSEVWNWCFCKFVNSIISNSTFKKNCFIDFTKKWYACTKCIIHTEILNQYLYADFRIFSPKNPKTEKSTGISYVAIFLKKSVNWFDGKIIVGTWLYYDDWSSFTVIWRWAPDYNWSLPTSTSQYQPTRFWKIFREY